MARRTTKSKRKATASGTQVTPRKMQAFRATSSWDKNGKLEEDVEEKEPASPSIRRIHSDEKLRAAKTSGSPSRLDSLFPIEPREQEESSAAGWLDDSWQQRGHHTVDATSGKSLAAQLQQALAEGAPADSYGSANEDAATEDANTPTQSHLVLNRERKRVPWAERLRSTRFTRSTSDLRNPTPENAEEEVEEAEPAVATSPGKLVEGGDVSPSKRQRRHSDGANDVKLLDGSVWQCDWANHFQYVLCAGSRVLLWIPCA